MRNQRSAAGFTLIELMIAVAIIGILSTTAITLFKYQQLRTKRTEGTTNVEALVKMIRAYFGEAGRYPATAGTWPASAPTPAVVQWDAASTAAFGAIGFRAEQAIRYRYDVDAGAECGVCPTGGCFTVIGYSDLDGDAGIGAVGYYHRDSLLIECPATLFGWLAPLDVNTGTPIYDAAVPFPKIGGIPLAPDDY
jgi:prepilin-type N-terminal cleavage/methylation domain-containing protein